MNSINSKKIDWILIRNLSCLFLLVVAIFGFRLNQKLNQISWQELKQNEVKEKEVLSCLNYLEKISINNSATHKQKYLWLKKGSGCLKQLSFVPEEILPYQKIFQLEKEIEVKEIKEIDYKLKGRIENNRADIAVYFWDKIRASMVEITLVQSIFLSLPILLLFLCLRYGLLSQEEEN